jgi:hypothetical protein
MSDQVREQLLGYLLDALEEDERRQVERELAASPALRRELTELRACLAPLAADREPVHPPRGLWQRTCRLVELSARVMSGSAAASRWSLRDGVAAAVVLIAACLMFFPAVQRSRFQAGVTACQYNLGQLGLALLRYSDNHGGAFPRVPPKGNDAMAGVFAISLRENGLLDNPALIVCPAVAALREDGIYIPTLDELCQARDWELVRLQRGMMGDYGYPLGIVVNGQYLPIRNQCRMNFALMSDAPSARLDGRPSSNHGPQGQNVLFEAGNVRFMRFVEPQPGQDYPFLNEECRVAPGCHENDAVIAPAHATPALYIRP